HPGASAAAQTFGAAPKIDEAIEDLLANPKDVRVDLLTCNGQVVLQSVVIGDTSVLASAPANGTGPLAFLRRLKGLERMRLRSFRLTTQREKSIETAALGIVAVEHGRSTSLARWTEGES